MNWKDKDKLYPVIFILLFFALMFVPLINLKISPGDIDTGFYGRDKLINGFTDFRLFIRDKVFPQTVVGKSHWLFYTEDNNADDYQKTNPFSESELEEIKNDLDNLNAQYKKEGITLLVVVAPNKSTIYPDYMLSEIPVLGKTSRLDQVVNYMNEHGNTKLLDLRPALIKARQAHQVFYATDTHWNDYGAYAGYNMIISNLAQAYPALKPRPLSAYKPDVSNSGRRDLTKIIGGTFEEKQFQLKPKFTPQASYKHLSVGGSTFSVFISSTPDKTLPSAVFFHDSFIYAMLPMLGEHFSRATYITYNTDRSIWSLSWVQDERPDIVVIELVERKLDNLKELFIH